jgi:hypothetical protein
MGLGKSVQQLRGGWDKCERRLRHPQCTINILGTCEGWMLLTNLGASIHIRFYTKVVT